MLLVIDNQDRRLHGRETVEDVGFGGKRKVSAIKVERPPNLSSFRFLR